MLLPLRPSVSLILRGASDKRFATIHMRHSDKLYECVAVYETTHRIYDLDSMDQDTRKHIEDAHSRHTLASGQRAVSDVPLSKRQKTLAVERLKEFMLNNEAHKSFIDPPVTTRCMEPYESRIYYMEDEDKFYGIGLKLVREEIVDARHITLFLRMELPWREPVHGVEVNFLSASNIKLVFETLESE